MQTAQRKPKHRPMTDEDIREHLEITIFHGIWVSQRNIDDYRKSERIPKKKD
jgi:hypothetical protein